MNASSVHEHDYCFDEDERGGDLALGVSGRTPCRGPRAVAHAHNETMVEQQFHHPQFQSAWIALVQM